jgi:hypothetical protein
MTKNREEWEFIFEQLSIELARQNPISVTAVKEELQGIDLLGWTEKQLLKGAISVTKVFRNRSQFGRLRAALLMGLTVAGSKFLTQIERAQVFLDEDTSSAKFTEFLKSFRAEIANTNDRDWLLLCRRLSTYISFRELISVISKPHTEILSMLRIQPRDAIQKVLSLANLAFLHTYFDFPIDPWLSRWFQYLGAVEEIASIASILVAIANEYRPLDSYDLVPPMGAELASPDIRRLMEYGKTKMLCHEAAKDLSFFGYELEKIGSQLSHAVFYLKPPSPNFEYGRRLGFIRSEIGLSRAQFAANTKDQASRFSISTAAQVFASKFRQQLQDIRDDHTPLRRLRIVHHIGPKMFEMISRIWFYEDQGAIERSVQDFLTPFASRNGKKVQLTNTLDLETFVNLSRYFQFLCLVDIHLLRPFASTDHILLANSLIRVAKKSDHVELLTAAGISREQAEEFFRLVNADVKKLGYYDLQYKPFLLIAQATIDETTSPPEIVHLPGVVSTANFFRNVQVANQIRIVENAELFVDVVATILNTRFARVSKNRSVKSAAGATDIDVAVLAGKVLFIFECKHSVPPTNPHEMRDVWEDIEKAAKQLRTALAALSTPVRLSAYLKGWFPNISADEVKDIQIVPCILCSHRIFAGVDHEGFPIRDFSSLTKLIEDGVVGMGTVINDESVMVQYRVAGPDGFTSEDLADYLSSGSKFFQMFRKFMIPYCKIQRLGSLTLARETYLYSVDLEEWCDLMENLGCSRLPDARRQWKPPWSFEELQSAGHNDAK